MPASIFQPKSIRRKKFEGRLSNSLVLFHQNSGPTCYRNERIFGKNEEGSQVKILHFLARKDREFMLFTSRYL
jgi:hypothetical protein